MSNFLKSLFGQVVVALVLGVLIGVIWPDFAVQLKPLGDGFIKFIKMAIGPLVFGVVVHGIVGAGDLKKVGRVGLKALIYFEAVTTIALVLGIILAYAFGPGVGMNIDPKALDAKALSSYTEHVKEVTSTVDFLLKIVPTTIFDAFTKGDILQVLLFSVMFGFAVRAAGAAAGPVLALLETLSAVVFGVVGIIMRLAPLGAFGAMAFTIGKYGLGTLKSLGLLMACFYATCLIFIFVVLGLIARAHGFSIFRFVRYLRDELLIVLGTSSSESVLPRMLSKMEAAGAAKPVVGLVIPTGYSFNLDGTSIYLTMAAVFIAQATNTPMTLLDQLTLLSVLLLTSKGAAGVTGSGFIVLAATLSALGTLPVTAVALILGIDRFMSEARALTNLVGNGVATVVVAKWCGALDEQRLQQELRK